jgi:ABC-type amino acid transport substrate-binding protein
MKNKLSLLALLVATLALGLALAHPLPQSVQKESAYERVLRTITLRCGYIVAPPIITIDPNTKAVGGVNYDYAEAMAKLLGLRVTWQEIVYGQQIEALHSNKIDAVCGAEGPMITGTSLYLRYTEPLVYIPIYLYVRANDTRFDGSREKAFEKADNPDVTVAYMDGDITQDFSTRLFPRAKQHELPQTADYSQIYMDVALGKADFVIDDPFTAGDFMKNNSGKLRKVELGKPVAILPNVMSVLRGEEALADLLSQGIHLIRQRGLEDQILHQTERDYPGQIYRVQEPYKIPSTP